jgi:hypothetical protein
MTQLQNDSNLCDVRSESRRDHLRVTIAGVRSTVKASIAVWREVGRQVQASGARRVLVISELSGPMPTPDEQHRIMGALVGCGFEGVRTAFVLVDAAGVSTMEHGEIAARELGQETRVFGSEALAVVWLRHGI